MSSADAVLQAPSHKSHSEGPGSFQNGRDVGCSTREWQRFCAEKEDTMECDDFADLQSTWEELAKQDPLWAILSVPAKKGGKWGVEEFFSQGRAEATRVLQKVTSLHSLRFEAALDFGCGVGRVTQYLADQFQKVIGVDISAKMIELAGQFKQSRQNLEYRHNPHRDARHV